VLCTGEATGGLWDGWEWVEVLCEGGGGGGERARCSPVDGRDHVEDRHDLRLYLARRAEDVRVVLRRAQGVGWDEER
jgi:hypothetical protein